jgi:hypothetical protein
MVKNGGEITSDAMTESQRRREAIRAAVRRPIGRQRVDTAPRAGLFTSAAKLPAASIFVCYARDNTDVVRPLVTQLRTDGLVVTWDQDFFGGADFRQAICDAIDAARSVIVVWSSESAKSPFVCDEAMRALNARKLITTHVEGFNLRNLPLGFGHLNTIPVGDRERVRNSLKEHGIDLRGTSQR